MELLRQVLEDKEKEIRGAKDELRQVKEEVIHLLSSGPHLLKDL